MNKSIIFPCFSGKKCNLIKEENIMVSPSTTVVSYQYSPGYVSGMIQLEGIVEHKGSVDNGQMITIKYLEIAALSRTIWNDADKRKKIIDEHNYIYIKSEERTGKIVEIGVHADIIKQIKEFGLTRIRFEKDLLPQSTFVQPMQEGSYATMIETFKPALV